MEERKMSIENQIKKTQKKLERIKNQSENLNEQSKDLSKPSDQKLNKEGKKLIKKLEKMIRDFENIKKQNEKNASHLQKIDLDSDYLALRMDISAHDHLQDTRNKLRAPMERIYNEMINELNKLIEKIRKSLK